MLHHNNYENTYTEYAKANVINVETRTSRSVVVVNMVPVVTSKKEYEVKYSFVASDGITYGGKDTVSWEPGKDVITIRYNPDDPTENDIP